MHSATKSARRTLLALGVMFLVMGGALGAGVLTHQATVVPGLSLDLAGGYRVILSADTADGSKVDPADLAMAVEIIRKRVDPTGSTEAEIQTQGENNIIVSLPGDPDQATIDAIKQAALMQFRPVLVSGLGYSLTVDPSASPSVVADPSTSAAVATDPSADPSAMAEASPSATATASPSASPSASATADDAVTPTATPVDPSDFAWITPEIQAQYDALNCLDVVATAGGVTGDPNAAFVTCSPDGATKYILGPVELDGTDIASTSAGPHYSQAGTPDGEFEVRLEFKGGGDTFYEVTKRISALEPPRNQFAILLDGLVISDPRAPAGIPGGQASITGSFTLQSATQLSNQLKFGALPLTLTVQSEEKIAATKGESDLYHGLLAGLIGLGLVVVYTIFQYRALGLVTIGSLIISGGLTYLAIGLLSWGPNYRLSLAGVIGLVVSIGITADSFIVYFERVRDELREGRSLVAAVEHGWTRAKRTILASDAVNFLAAVVLYILAVGNVRGFAFTLGLTTVIDLAVVFLFTHPTLVLLARTSFFGGGHKLSGLDPRQLGRDSLYKGRGRIADPTPSKAMTLAERKAAAKSASATEGDSL